MTGTSADALSAMEKELPGTPTTVVSGTVTEATRAKGRGAPPPLPSSTTTTDSTFTVFVSDDV